MMSTRYAHHKIVAVLTAVAMTSQVTEAFAQTGRGDNLTGVTSKIVQSTSTLPNLITSLSYIGGIGLGVAGIFKLKNHVDAPAQVPMKDGLVRLGASGGLLALPYFTTALMNTAGNQTQGFTAPKFNPYAG